MINATLIATIGTRDLMYQTRYGDWYNIGDDQIRGNIIGEQAEVLADLGQDLLTFRQLTQFLLQHWDVYRDRIRPVILGQLLQTQAEAIQRVYLIGTDQPETVPYRNKDTCYACQLLQAWFQYHYPAISVTWLPLGNDGTNPSNFEAMFRWWQRTWPNLVSGNSTNPIWLCIKGGVGQSSEAGRISGLSQYGDRIQFFEFQQRCSQNRQGIPSDFTGPFSGRYYLWSRAQQQVLQLLDRYDYVGAEEILRPYYQQDSARFAAVPTWLQAGMAWNRGEFKTFYQRVKSTLSQNLQVQGQQWWWMAYEQARLAVTRLIQGNTSEAMLHSFRAVEGQIWEWLDTHIGQHINYLPNQYPQLLVSITTVYPELKERFKNRQTGESFSGIKLNGYVQKAVIESALPQIGQNQDMKIFWGPETRNHRNMLSHRLGGISEDQLYSAWGRNIRTSEQWQLRILACLNVLSSQNFKSVDQASLFPQIHKRVIDYISKHENDV